MASELDVLLDKVEDPALRADLKRQIDVLRGVLGWLGCWGGWGAGVAGVLGDKSVYTPGRMDVQPIDYSEPCGSLNASRASRTRLA
jgi:hypothetical protein